MLLPTMICNSGPCLMFPTGEHHLEAGLRRPEMAAHTNSLSTESMEYLRSILSYDSDSGNFMWRVRRRGHRGEILPGAVAGSISTTTGYRYIRVDGTLYACHRLAVLFSFPDADQTMHVDHINGIRADNRLGNLRLATRSENMQNMTAAKPYGRSKYVGVHFDPQTGKWKTAIRIGGKSKHLGRFDTQEKAHAVYVEAKRKFHTFASMYEEKGQS